MKCFRVIILIALAIFCFTNLVVAEEVIKYDFESGKEGWEIPDWALEQKDHVGTSVEVTSEVVYKGDNSLEIMCDFPGDVWRAAIVQVEFESNKDFSGAKEVICYIYLPKKARNELMHARIILTTGLWQFIEQREPVELKPGRWNKIKAKLDVTEETERAYWKIRRQENSLLKHINNIKKIAIRIEYNANISQTGPAYAGPIYIDEVVVK